MKEESVSQRFAALIGDLGISKNAFAKSLGRTATVVQHLIDGRNKPGFDLLETLFTIYPNVSKDWIMLGKGPRYTDQAADTGAAPEESQPLPAPSKPSDAPLLIPTIAPQLPTRSVAPADLSPAPKAAPTVAPPVSEVAAPPAIAGKAATPPVAEAVSSSAPAAPAAPTPPAGPDAHLLAQQVIHQLAMAEQRAQFLEQQQQLMHQMIELMRKS
ncbi:hypothetical protein SAMN00120144_3661 [Hymenobacter roseosalivarius DSM 11622]|uniref:HTH cro/C1-type domain-containing protein n=1 Tax=Hymenobacter roseosalivarius DSM 11622 TaxID=645990 RepID=A0A1W1W1M3_9BACT|nr:hypothetical protein [Hymenobacter roseosalivarius]SMB99004.1 hypothetical protein SAMN00120144_3661 [Hymenobacter roseosalivarius DSM 11622]